MNTDEATLGKQDILLLLLLLFSTEHQGAKSVTFAFLSSHTLPHKYVSIMAKVSTSFVHFHCFPYRQGERITE